MEEALNFNVRCSDGDRIEDIATKAKIMKHVKFICSKYFYWERSIIHCEAHNKTADANCAPRLANLTIYIYQAEYVDRLLHQEGEIEDARLHMNTRRFIDDMISFGTEPPGSEWYARSLRIINSNMGNRRTIFYVPYEYNAYYVCCYGETQNLML